MSLPPAHQAPVTRAPTRLGLALMLAMMAALPASAAGVDRLLSEPAPLVLKDGRIARVSIYAVRFPTGSAVLDPATARALDKLIGDEATDCFLTAQAIGHAEAPPADSGDTLAEHRLARARADRVRDEMIGRGLAASAIASVWDWQFVVKEPRVTLWIFDLPKGSDCKGTPLGPPAPVASAAPATGEATASDAPPSEEPSQPAETVSGPQAEPASPPAAATEQAQASEPPAPASPATPPEPPTVASVEQAPAPSAPTASSEPAAPTMPTSPASEDAAAPGDKASTEAEEPAKAPDESPAPATEAPSAPPSAAAPEKTEETAATEEASAAATASIPFDVNSSFLSKAASQRLRELAGQLREGGRFTVELAATVGGEVKDASSQQASRYNRWMAERRIGRVTDWLKQNAGKAQLEFKSGFIEEDGSPRVRVRLEPAG